METLKFDVRFKWRIRHNLKSVDRRFRQFFKSSQRPEWSATLENPADLHKFPVYLELVAI